VILIDVLAHVDGLTKPDGKKFITSTNPTTVTICVFVLAIANSKFI